MRTLIQLLVLFLFALPAHAQLSTTNLDAFNRSNDNVLGSTPTEPTSIQWSEKGEEVGGSTELTSEETIRLENEAALLQSGAKDGQKWATVDMSNLNDYPTTLDDADGTVVWAFNMRQNQEHLEGFSTGEHGLMFVLASSANDFSGSGNVYAVVLGEDGSEDHLKLVVFNGGYSAEGDFKEIATWSTDLATEYLSVRVTFDAGTKGWTLYAERGTSGYPYSDPRNVSAERGFGENAEETGDQQKFVGMLWNHGQDDAAKAFFDDIYVTDSGGELPVELTTFDATADGDAAHLRWETASETRNAGFEVQRDTERGFETIGFVEGAETTTESTRYMYTAEGLSADTHTFRLKQVDLDGSTTIGPERVVEIRPERLNVSITGPNPVHSGQPASFRLAAGTGQSVTVTLHDVLGRRIRTLYDGRIGPQGQDLSVSSSSLSAGMYFVRVQGSSGTRTRRITVAQ